MRWRTAVRRVSVALHPPRRYLEPAPGRLRRERGHLPLQGLSARERGTPPHHDPHRRRIYPPLPASCSATRLPPYAYKKKILLDADAGHLEIDPVKAEIVTRIFRDFASGLSSVKIATALNEEGIPGPRGGEWNASTIRGNPKVLTGILNNPLYIGRLVWGRRQWRRNPDSEMREAALSPA